MGPSALGACHGADWVRSSDGDVPVAIDMPSVVSCWPQMWVGLPSELSSLFHSRYRLPLAGSTYGLGSMDPPLADWQIKGPLEVSLNVPPGLADVATEMHCSLSELSRTV
jgi:hypothetical protein